MKLLFILQLVCCTITAMLAVHLALASLQVRWKVWRYEMSRWLLCAAMLLFSFHYFLQMTQGFRARGADVGAVFNIMFYTPAAFAITLSILNMESTGRNVRRYCLRSAAAYALIAIVFAFGVVTSRSLHIGSLLYVMLGLFVASMAYFINVSRHAIASRKESMMADSGADLIPYVRYSQASITLLYFAAAFLPIAILFNTLLIYVGPLMLLTVVFFVHSFISLGYYITPKEKMPGEEDDAPCDVGGAEGECGGEAEDRREPSAAMTDARLKEIETAIRQWCAAGLYKDCDVNIYSLAAKLGCKKDELTQYFNLSEHTNFRTWLSDIRFNEAVRMMEAFPTYSNDAISTECGFSSHTQIYRVFKQKTGMSPSQWRARLASS